MADTGLRRGWTTGACAAAAAKAACAALLTGRFPDPVEIALPGGHRPAFALARQELGNDEAMAAIVKDAGDDPDVTHGALVCARVRRGQSGGGLAFKAGKGVGTVTLAGLPLPPGEPAINPAPRKMIAAAIAEVSPDAQDFEIEIAVPDGEKMAQRTMNPRLGIVGGISILGTTGVVIPFSCAAWIHSIYRGIDVARALGYDHVAGATGNVSERATQAMHGLDEQQLIDMGDFIGGMLKYLRTHPVPKVTVAGGVAKMTKLAQGMLDVHSKRGHADLDALAEVAREAGESVTLVDEIRNANTVAEAFGHAQDAGFALGDAIAARAWETAAEPLAGCGSALEILLFDREGRLQGRKDFAPVHDAALPRKRR